jgi:hypothetical protein
LENTKNWEKSDWGSHILQLSDNLCAELVPTDPKTADLYLNCYFEHEESILLKTFKSDLATKTGVYMDLRDQALTFLFEDFNKASNLIASLIK